MKVQYIQAVSKLEGKIRIPIIDVRDGKDEREEVGKIVKRHNGNTSKFVPAKFGYGTFGPKKY